MTDFTIILRSMRVRMFSTVTTVVTAAVAVALMLVILSMKDSGRKAFERGSGDMHLVVTAGGASPIDAVLNCIFYANPPRSPLAWTQFEELQKRAPWAYAIPTQQGDSYAGQPVLATTEDFFAKFKPNPGESWKLKDGRFFTAPFEVVVGAAAAAATDLRVGDRIYLAHGVGKNTGPTKAPPKEEEHAHDDHDHAHDHDHDHDHDHAHDEAHAEDGTHVHDEFVYTVVGVLEPTGGSHDRAVFTDLKSTWIIHAHERRVRETPDAKTTEADLLPADRLITGVYLRLVTREGSDAPANLPQVFDTLRRDGSITVAQPAQEIAGLFKIVSNIDKLFVAIAAVVMVSSGIAILLALYNSMEQRRRQIAVLRVLGASQARVFGLVITESVLIGVLGAAVGIVLAMVGAALAAGVLKESIGLVVSPSLPPVELVSVVVATVALSAVAGAIPAAVAYRTSVARNLRPLG
ncbi:MAG: ABC transporter permease [Phycisphaerales bacterium]